MPFNVAARDLVVFAFVIVAKLALAVVASIVRTRRAAAVDPDVALHSEWRVEKPLTAERTKKKWPAGIGRPR
jgi:hypothetical protein